MQRITALYLSLSYFLHCLIPITTIVQSREYHVKETRNISYMYRQFNDIKDEIFPADIRINVSVSRSVGTLLYSIDKNMNQLIVTLHNGLPHSIKVEFNKEEVIWSIPELCGCASGRYEILDLKIQLNTHIIMQCNGRNPYYFKIIKEKALNENYPILFPRLNTNKASTNEAHLWLVNTPQYENVYPNNEQMYGCIFKVSYLDKQINFTNTTSDITHPCLKKCSPNVCNGGQCLEAYNDYPVCNCTASFLNGRFCNESIRPMNLQSSNQKFIFDMIKLSWNSSLNTIFTISNKKLSISLDILKKNIFVELKYLKKYNLKVSLSQNYVHDNPSICIAYFQEKFINIWLFNDGSWSNGQILSEYELRREIFDTLTLQSGNGNISFYTKSNEDYAWKRVNIVKSIEIKNGPSTSVIIAVSITIIIVVPSISIGIVFVKRRSKKKIKYPKLKEYIKLCICEIGYDIVKKVGTDFNKWNSFILKKIQVDAISSHRLERMYQVMKNITQEDTYLVIYWFSLCQNNEYVKKIKKNFHMYCQLS